MTARNIRYKRRRRKQVLKVKIHLGIYSRKAKINFIKSSRMRKMYIGFMNERKPIEIIISSDTIKLINKNLKDLPPIVDFDFNSATFIMPSI